MVIDSMFSIAGRGTVVTGVVKKIVSIGDTVTVKSTSKSYRVAGIECFKKSVKTAPLNQSCGLLLYVANRNDIKNGDELICE